MMAKKSLPRRKASSNSKRLKRKKMKVQLLRQLPGSRCLKSTKLWNKNSWTRVMSWCQSCWTTTQLLRSTMATPAALHPRRKRWPSLCTWRSMTWPSPFTLAASLSSSRKTLKSWELTRRTRMTIAQMKSVMVVTSSCPIPLQKCKYRGLNP